MPGLGPGIHDLRSVPQAKSWMAGTSPAMTGNQAIEFNNFRDKKTEKRELANADDRPLYLMEVGVLAFRPYTLNNT